jgi:hypothetical protein
LREGDMTMFEVAHARGKDRPKMVPTDLLPEEGIPLQCPACAGARADTEEGFIHPFPKALIKAGPLGLGEIA